MNTLYYGYNLKILREYIKDETINLVYLDTPFNFNRDYNVLFKDESGKKVQMPPSSITFKQVEKIKQTDEQHRLF
jgi:hypothetical protein